MITATIYGRLTKDPETMTPANGGNPYVRFTIASSKSRKDAQGNTPAEFVNVTAFGKQGEAIATYFHKASRIVVHARDLESYAYIGNTDNLAHGNIGCILTGFEFVDTKTESMAAQTATARPGTSQYGQSTVYGQTAPAYGAPPYGTPQSQQPPAMPPAQPAYNQQTLQPQTQAPAYQPPTAPPVGAPWGNK